MTEPKRLGKYEIREEIGRGGFAVVYEARDTELDRVIALKVLHPQLTTDSKFVQRFRQEARTAAGLRHPHIVTIHDVGEEAGQHYLAMEFLPGQPLSQLVKSEPLPIEQAVFILGQVAGALDAVHQQGLIHRDVKPSNIRVDDKGQATLLDFGIVRAAEGTRLTTTMAVLGTPEYMAPEHAEIEGATGIDWRVDVYALGVVAYEILVGRPPFTGTSPTGILYKHIHEPPPRPTALNSDLPQMLEPVLLKALAKKREERYQSAEEMVRALAQATGAEEPAPLEKQARKPVRQTQDTMLWERDGKLMVRVPAGEFLYGKKKKKRKLHTFWIDKTPVTNGEYACFVAATGHEPPKHWKGKTPPEKIADHPVVYVSWHDAVAYAEWAGKRLPTEEEWEKAARGTDGREYPWGEWAEGRCNSVEAGIGMTTPVGRYSPDGDSPYGCVDMAGNVWEWTSTSTIIGRVVRGGSWGDYRVRARCAYRPGRGPFGLLGDGGFRCVSPVP